jgi:hypothetical protein
MENKKITISAPGIELSMLIIACCSLYSTGHYVGGLVCVLFIGLMFQSNDMADKRSSVDEVALKEAMKAYVNERDGEDPMSPYERDAAQTAFRAGARWQEIQGDPDVITQK